MINKFKLLVFGFLVTGQFLLAQEALSTKDIVEKMLVSDKNIKSYQYTQKAWERMSDGKLLYSEVKTKIWVSPYKFYCYNVTPTPGIEVLYNSALNPAEAIVKPNGFPWVNLSLDPNGTLMRKDQHHALYDAGFDFALKVLKNGYERSKQYGFEKIFTQLKDTLWNGNWCYVVQITSPDYKYIDYTVQAKENLIEIAKKKFVNEYALLMLNPSVSDLHDLDSGQRIKIPNAYAKKTIVYIDKKSFLPIVQIMYDDKGVYEKYEYLSLKINPAFTEKEFTTEYEGYGF